MAKIRKTNNIVIFEDPASVSPEEKEAIYQMADEITDEIDREILATLKALEIMDEANGLKKGKQ